MHVYFIAWRFGSEDTDTAACAPVSPAMPQEPPSLTLTCDLCLECGGRGRGSCGGRAQAVGIAGAAVQASRGLNSGKCIWSVLALNSAQLSVFTSALSLWSASPQLLSEGRFLVGIVPGRLTTPFLWVLCGFVQLGQLSQCPDEL